MEPATEGGRSLVKEGARELRVDVMSPVSERVGRCMMLYIAHSCAARRESARQCYRRRSRTCALQHAAMSKLGGADGCGTLAQLRDSLLVMDDEVKHNSSRHDSSRSPAVLERRAERTRNKDPVVRLRGSSNGDERERRCILAAIKMMLATTRTPQIDFAGRP